MGTRRQMNPPQPPPAPPALAAVAPWVLAANNGLPSTPNWLATMPLAVWVPLVILLLLAAVGAVWAAIRVRRMITGEEDASGADGLSMDSLRTMKEKGLISAEEYERLRKAIALRELERVNKPKSGGLYGDDD